MIIQVCKDNYMYSLYSYYTININVVVEIWSKQQDVSSVIVSACRLDADHNVLVNMKMHKCVANRLIIIRLHHHVPFHCTIRSWCNHHSSACTQQFIWWEWLARAQVSPPMKTAWRAAIPQCTLLFYSKFKHSSIHNHALYYYYSKEKREAYRVLLNEVLWK